MKKITLLLRNTGIILCAPTCAAATIPLTSSVSQLNIPQAPRAIPREWLNIKVEGDRHILTGFVPGVTVDVLRESNYSILELPDDDNDYVTEIAPYAFAYMFDGFAASINNIVLNKQLTKIGQGAFTYCTGITKHLDFSQTKLETIEQDAFNMCQDMPGELKFPSTLKTIGSCAFKNCDCITSLVLPPSIETIGDYAFNNCISVSEVHVELDEESVNDKQLLPPWTGQVSYAFQNLGSDSQEEEKNFYVSNFYIAPDEWETILQDNLQLDASWNITCGDREAYDETTLIIDGTTLRGFKGGITASAFNVIRIPDGITSIAEDAFANAITTPTQIVFNDDLTSIGPRAFAGCSGLNCEIHLPNTVETLGESAFEGSGITGKLILPTNDKFVSIPKYCFKNCDWLNEIVIPTQIGEYEDGICEHAFASCDRLSFIDVSALAPEATPKWRTKYDAEQKPFTDVKGTGTIKYPYNATPSVPEGNIGNKLVSLGMQSPIHDYWSPIMNVAPNIPFPYNPAQPSLSAYRVADDKLIGLSSTFAQEEIKTNYQIIEIPSGIKKIRSQAFNSVFTHLTTDADNTHNWTLKFKPGIEEIESQAFYDCTGIYGDIVLPSTLKTIGEKAFMGVLHWNSITIPPSVKKIGPRAFLQLPSEMYQTIRGKYIDLTQFNSVPTTWWESEEDNYSFMMHNTGTIYVKNALRDEWVVLLQQMGLNKESTDKWSVVGI